MKFFPKFLTRFSILFLFSSLVFCCSQKPAQIVNHSNEVFNKNNSYRKSHNNNNYKKIVSSNYSKGSGFSIKVQAGDNLYKISKQYNASIYDIIKANDLEPPYFLIAGQSLNIPLSKYHKIAPGETLYSISRNYNMTLSQLVRLNNLQSPYILKTGTNLKISDKESSSSPAKVEPQKVATSYHGIVSHNLLKSNRFIWPTKGQIISKFGAKSGGLYNDGINIKAKIGEPVKSAEDGVVAYVGNELKGYGNLIIIKHAGGWITAYAHLNDFSVKRGQKISQSSQIGTVGMTGNVNEAQLYFSLRKGRDALNPQNYLK